ncbi:MAG: PQQ-binding-like beta-propeller repeat protein, partial [Steroidobacteraceae bacterium]
MSKVSCVVAALAALALHGSCQASAQRTQPAAVDSHARLSNAADGADWAAYGRTYDESHHSPLSQIDAKNIQRLGLAWSFDLPTMSSSVGAPLAIDGVLYFAVGLSELYAFDAASGRQLWHYDPEVARVAGERLKGAWGIRGIAWWNGKIYVGTQDGRLIAVDAKTGTPVWSVQTLPE